MTLYVKAIVGRAFYLIAATRVSDVAPAAADAAEPVVDCRSLFGEAVGAEGYRLVVDAGSDETVALVVDRIDGLVELDDDAFRPLPPIGRFGAAIDAVSVPADRETPALRLVVGPGLLAEVSG